MVCSELYGDSTHLYTLYLFVAVKSGIKYVKSIFKISVTIFCKETISNYYYIVKTQYIMFVMNIM